MPPSGQCTATERPATPLWNATLAPVYVPRHARSGSDPTQLLDGVLLKLRAEPGFAALGEALSRDILETSSCCPDAAASSS